MSQKSVSKEAFLNRAREFLADIPDQELYLLVKLLEMDFEKAFEQNPEYFHQLLQNSVDDTSRPESNCDDC